MTLPAYDGSSDAQAAIDHTATLLPGDETTVLTVWSPFLDVAPAGSWGGTARTILAGRSAGGFAAPARRARRCPP